MSEKRRQNDGTDKIFAARTTDEIIAVMREEDEAAAREKILQAMTPACRKKLKYFETWLRKEVSHTLRSRYELGLQVQELYEDERKNGGKLYGRNAIGRICKLLRWDDGVIRMALRFVRTFTPEDLERLCALVLPGGEPLTWSHVRVLLTVDDATRQQELLERTAAEGWTCTELAREIKNLEDRPAGDGRGRPPRVPKDFDGAVAQQQQSAEEWDRLHTRVWGKQDRSLLTQAAKLPPEGVTEERLRQARVLAVQLRRVADQALAQAEKAEQVVRDFERILSERQQEEMPAETGSTAGRRTT
jgi:hypothetical protein